LFFLRFAPALRAQGATLELAGDPRLHAMLARTGLFDAAAARLEELAPADRDVVLAGDLPLLVAGAASGTPPPLALTADPARPGAGRDRRAFPGDRRAGARLERCQRGPRGSACHARRRGRLHRRQQLARAPARGCGTRRAHRGAVPVRVALDGIGRSLAVVPAGDDLSPGRAGELGRRDGAPRPRPRYQVLSVFTYVGGLRAWLACSNAY